MWTAIPELAAYADLFNARQNKYRVKVVYKENPGRELLGTQEFPDLIVDQNLNGRRYSLLFSDLSFLFDRGGLSREDFYPSLLDLSVSNNQLLTLPLSFNLPLLYYKKSPNGPEDPLKTPEEIQGLLREFESPRGRGNFQTWGFSPLWNGGALLALAQLAGADFGEDQNSYPRWDQEGLERSFALQEEERRGRNKTLNDEIRFTDKYLGQPLPKLVLEGRILLGFADTREFHRIPPEERQDLHFFWLSDGQRVPANTDIYFAAIPRKGTDKKAGAEFLAWLFSRRGQEEILEYFQFNRIRSFGIARGLSSLIPINELVMVRHYPLLLGALPPARSILFPQALPPEWKDLRPGLLIPWLLDRARRGGAASGGGGAGEIILEEALRTWYNQQGRY
jgi:ABC-type glycerol-3-phosphate transport system substrate-binding protein